MATLKAKANGALIANFNGAFSVCCCEVPSWEYEPCEFTFDAYSYEYEPCEFTFDAPSYEYEPCDFSFDEYSYEYEPCSWNIAP